MKTKGRFRAIAPGHLEKSESGSGIDVEVVERTLLGQVVRGLRRAVKDQMWSYRLAEVIHSRLIADIEDIGGESRRAVSEPRQIPGGVAVLPEELTPHVVVDTVYLPAQAVEG